MFVNNARTTYVPTLAELSDLVHRLNMDRIGRVELKRIIFRRREEIEPFLNRLAGKGGADLFDRAPLDLAPWGTVCGVPIEIDPDLQGTSPRVEKRLA